MFSFLMNVLLAVVGANIRPAQDTDVPTDGAVLVVGRVVVRV